jgi:hypothetical protein
MKVKLRYKGVLSDQFVYGLLTVVCMDEVTRGVFSADHWIYRSGLSWFPWWAWFIAFLAIFLRATCKIERDK